MKFIYLANGVYDIEGFKKNISKINDDIKKEETKPELIIYGGNQIHDNNLNIDKETYNKFLSEIKVLNSSIDKYILCGSFDLFDEEYLIELDELYNKNNVIYNISYKLVDNSKTLLIFFNNQLSSIKSDNILNYILESDSIKYSNIKSVNDLIEMQIEELGLILKTNINVNSIIFITQSALVSPDYQNKKIDLNRMEENIKIFEWFNRYFYLLQEKKITWICTDFISRNESAIINIIKKDIDTQEPILELNINQYIIGMKHKTNFNFNFNVNDNEKIDEIFLKDFKVKNNELDIKWIFDIKYCIENINDDTEYFEYQSKNLNINFNNFIKKETNIDIETDVEKEKENKDIITSNNNLSEVKVKQSTDEEHTEEGDPYKQKYLKYKKKLYKLRSDKKQNKQH